MAGAAPTFWTTLVAQLRADRKRTVVLLGLLTVLLAVCLRLVFSGAPQESLADGRTLLPPTAGPTPVATPTVPQPSPPPVNPTAAALAPITFQTVESVRIEQMSRDLKRDPFRVRWSDLIVGAELEPSTPTRSASSQPSAWSFWQHWSMRLLQRESEIEGRRRQFETELSDLHLQATFLARPSRAVINGRMLEEGEYIGGFRLVRISARSVLLHKSGLNVRLTMP